MSRYVTQRRPSPARASDDWYPVGNAWNVPVVAEHEAVDTGLVNLNGDAILRVPFPVGFGRDDEW